MDAKKICIYPLLVYANKTERTLNHILQEYLKIRLE